MFGKRNLRKTFDIGLIVILTCCLLHAIVYLGIASVRPGFLSIFNQDGTFSLKFLDPFIWLFWYIGLRIIFHIGFLNIFGAPFLLGVAGLFLHALSIIVALLYGFLSGLTVMAVTICFTSLCLIWGKHRVKHYVDRQKNHHFD